MVREQFKETADKTRRKERERTPRKAGRDRTDVLSYFFFSPLGPEKIPQRWITGLKAGKELDQEISTFLRVAFSAKEE